MKCVFSGKVNCLSNCSHPGPSGWRADRFSVPSAQSGSQLECEAQPFPDTGSIPESKPRKLRAAL